MAVYVVERDLPGITMEQLAGAQRAAIEMSRRFSDEGMPARYIRSVFMPGEARCFCLFEAPDMGRVREVNEAAGLPYMRIMEAMDLTPER